MVAENKLAKAIQAIRDIIIEARTKTYEGVSHEMLASFLDDAEYFPALFVEMADNTLLFEKYLNEFCRKNNCMRIADKYQTR